MKTLIQEEAGKKEHRESDMFIFIVLSHGTKDYVYAFDGNPKASQDPNAFSDPDKGRLHITQDILKPFSSACTPNLNDIPKVFIIQACQGSKFYNANILLI